MSNQPSSSQYGKPWLRNAAMKFSLIFLFLITWFFATSAMATVTKEIHIEWQFDTSLPNLAGYKIFKDGALLVTLDNPSVQTLDYSVQLEEGTTVVFTMTAYYTNGTESSFSAPYSIDVPAGVPGGNVLPIARLSPSASTGETPHLVQFSATASTDSDGTIVYYAWDFGDGDTSTIPITNHAYTTAGSYTVTLTVTDNLGGVGTAHATVTVSSPLLNSPPTALFTSTLTSGNAPLVVGFDGSPSSDTDGLIVNYSWNFGDGTTATGASVSHGFSLAGSFTVNLTVTDDQGGQASYQRVITANNSANGPNAAFTVNPQTPTATEPVQFSGATSTAPNGTVVNYHWDFGDGQSATGVTASHTYEVPGTYTVTLTVLDNVNASGQASLALNVQSLESQQQRRRLLATIVIINTILLDDDEEETAVTQP